MPDLAIGLAAASIGPWRHGGMPALQTRKPPFQVMPQTTEGGEGMQTPADIPPMPSQHVVHQQLQHRGVLGGQVARWDKIAATELVPESSTAAILRASSIELRVTKPRWIARASKSKSWSRACSPRFRPFVAM